MEVSRHASLLQWPFHLARFSSKLHSYLVFVDVSNFKLKRQKALKRLKRCLPSPSPLYRARLKGGPRVW